MGSLRRGLILLALAAPSAAAAEVCDKQRPFWTPGTQATALDEAIFLFSTLPSLALIFATLLVLRLRSQWGGLAVVVLWTAYASLIAMVPPNEIDRFAAAEGCIGSPVLFISATVAICVVTILVTAPNPRRS